MRALAVALVLLATPAEALTIEQARGAVDYLHCRLYPSHERCRPAPPVAEQPPPPVPAPTPEPVQAPAPPPPPVQAAPPPPTPQAPAAPPQAVPAPPETPAARPRWPLPRIDSTAPPPPRAAPVVVRTPPKAKPRVKTKAVPTKPRRKRVDNSGPDLGWPCWMVRLRAGNKSCGELAAEGKRLGIRLSFKQLHQAATCIGRCFP